VLNGLSRDFPFEADQGEFLVNAYLYDVNLNFAPHWPRVKKINGHLRAHHRVLEVDIDQGILGPGLAVKQLSLVAPDLGLNHEKLLIHGQLSSPVKDMFAYLAKTPLAEKAKSWQVFGLQGQADLDLHLDIPLVKSNPEVLTLGHLNFPSQDMQLQLFINPLNLKKVRGFLDFDSQGVVNGAFSGALGQDLIHFAWQQQGDGSYRDFSLKGGVDLALLKSALNLEAASFAEGHMPFEAELRFPRAANKDLLMSWDSSLKGVSLALDQPWGKSSDEEKPLHLDLRLAANQKLSMELSYQNILWTLLREAKLWRVITHQQPLDGELRYDIKTGKIQAQLKTLDLNINLSKSNTFGQKPWKIKDMPDIDLNIDHFLWKGEELGRFKFSAAKANNQWLVNEMSLDNSNYAFLLRGDLSFVDRHYRSKIDAEMRFNHLAKALVSWGITPVADCKSGELVFSGAWPHASVNQLKLEELAGDLNVNLRRGNISHLDRETEQKIGLGKLLSILSLQTLPRRLQLDFSDLANNGFTFDVFQGAFHLQDGMLKTDNTMMDGPIAHVKINGGLNVLESWYDLELQVYPYITASLPVVATIAGGPLAGVATWAANHVLNQGMQKISGYTYRITGPWMKPVVQQVKMFHAKEDKIKEKNE
jgi:uncharacterized protein YhdP